eukprot:gnl/Dysnectes_brevis/3434_a4338_796.p1 GENE.gnl/Dysnectes_brevis/3434_a4338_796~~gnl/Dysnectes_brevis/3434_a4338_796.p1  ORF type:complete len:1335 (-),score=200.10 gnl/Dysnectes_brevis/3434_a4338_796:62-3718(-)
MRLISSQVVSSEAILLAAILLSQLPDQPIRPSMHLVASLRYILDMKLELGNSVEASTSLLLVLVTYPPPASLPSTIEPLIDLLIAQMATLAVSGIRSQNSIAAMLCSLLNNPTPTGSREPVNTMGDIVLRRLPLLFLSVMLPLPLRANTQTVETGSDVVIDPFQPARSSVMLEGALRWGTRILEVPNTLSILLRFLDLSPNTPYAIRALVQSALHIARVGGSEPLSHRESVTASLSTSSLLAIEFVRTIIRSARDLPTGSPIDEFLAPKAVVSTWASHLNSRPRPELPPGDVLATFPARPLPQLLAALRGLVDPSIPCSCLSGPKSMDDLTHFYALRLPVYHHGLPIEDLFRELFRGFLLGGEGQAVERAVKAIARAVCMVRSEGIVEHDDRLLCHMISSRPADPCTPGPDAARPLTMVLLSLIMLNTEILSAKTLGGRRMTCDDFINVLQQTDEGDTFDVTALTRMYNAVVAAPYGVERCVEEFFPGCPSEDAWCRAAELALPTIGKHAQKETIDWFLSSTSRLEAGRPFTKAGVTPCPVVGAASALPLIADAVVNPTVDWISSTLSRTQLECGVSLLGDIGRAAVAHKDCAIVSRICSGILQNSPVSSGWDSPTDPSLLALSDGARQRSGSIAAFVQDWVTLTMSPRLQLCAALAINLAIEAANLDTAIWSTLAPTLIGLDLLGQCEVGGAQFAAPFPRGQLRRPPARPQSDPEAGPIDPIVPPLNSRTLELDDPDYSILGGAGDPPPCLHAATRLLRASALTSGHNLTHLLNGLLDVVRACLPDTSGMKPRPQVPPLTAYFTAVSVMRLVCEILCCNAEASRTHLLLPSLSDLAGILSRGPSPPTEVFKGMITLPDAAARMLVALLRGVWPRFSQDLVKSDASLLLRPLPELLAQSPIALQACGSLVARLLDGSLSPSRRGNAVVGQVLTAIHSSVPLIASQPQSVVDAFSGPLASIVAVLPPPSARGFAATLRLLLVSAGLGVGQQLGRKSTPPIPSFSRLFIRELQGIKAASLPRMGHTPCLPLPSSSVTAASITSLESTFKRWHKWGAVDSGRITAEFSFFLVSEVSPELTPASCVVELVPHWPLTTFPPLVALSQLRAVPAIQRIVQYIGGDQSTLAQASFLLQQVLLPMMLLELPKTLYPSLAECLCTLYMVAVTDRTDPAQRILAVQVVSGLRVCKSNGVDTIPIPQKMLTHSDGCEFEVIKRETVNLR